MANQKSVSPRQVRNDIILIVGLLLVVVFLGIYLFFFRTHGNMVKVTVNGELYATYPLTQNLTEDIHTGENELNRLVIREGKVFVETATCPDGICSAHRPIFRDGESIVCLPHGVVITVITDETTDESIDISL